MFRRILRMVRPGSAVSPSRIFLGSSFSFRRLPALRRQLTTQTFSTSSDLNSHTFLRRALTSHLSNQIRTYHSTSFDFPTFEEKIKRLSHFQRLDEMIKHKHLIQHGERFNLLKLLPHEHRLLFLNRFPQILSAPEFRETLKLLDEPRKEQLFAQYSTQDFEKMFLQENGYRHPNILNGVLSVLPEENQLTLINMLGARNIFNIVYYGAPNPSIRSEELLKNLSHKVKTRLIEYLFDKEADRCKKYYLNDIFNNKSNQSLNNPLNRLIAALKGLPLNTHHILLRWIGRENLVNIIYSPTIYSYRDNLSLLSTYLSAEDEEELREMVAEAWPRKRQQESDQFSKEVTDFTSKTIEAACTTLGVRSNATPGEIIKAYYMLARRHHPDHGGTNEEFIRIKNAYDTLSAKPSLESRLETPSSSASFRPR